MKLLAAVVGMVLASGSITESFAHEGHGTTPGSVQAPHGGVIRGTKSLYLELVNDASGLKLYPLTHELAPIPLAELTLSATAQVPKKAKVPVKLLTSGDHFEADAAALVSVKGAYRYQLEVNTGYHGKKEKVVFQMEPQN